MNAETTELIAIEKTVSTEERLDIFALSFDDLDLVGGGIIAGLVS
jgi:hypothetical protein